MEVGTVTVFRVVYWKEPRGVSLAFFYEVFYPTCAVFFAGDVSLLGDCD